MISDKVFFGSFDGSVYVLSAAKGELIKKYQTEDFVSTTPAIFGGQIYVISFDHNMYVFEVP